MQRREQQRQSSLQENIPATNDGRDRDPIPVSLRTLRNSVLFVYSVLMFVMRCVCPLAVYAGFMEPVWLLAFFGLSTPLLILCLMPVLKLSVTERILCFVITLYSLCMVLPFIAFLVLFTKSTTGNSRLSPLVVISPLMVMIVLNLCFRPLITYVIRVYKVML